MTLFISQFVVELLAPFGGDVPPPPTPTPEARTVRFDAGLGSNWWIVPQLDDSSDNLRDKAVKSFVATGKMTVPRFSIYAYGPADNIDVATIEAGTNSASGKKLLPTTTQVQRSARKQINIPNAMLHTVRLEGTWDGQGIVDRVDEIVYEVARQGIRR
jgi:hypothetical protein